jgi:N6-L-threonylcarbamoyladenine synthase
MNILGIESSCDETAAAIVDARLQVRAQVVATQIDLHRVTHGVVPEVAARTHTEKILPVIDECLRQAGMTHKDIDAIAVTRGPGLVTSLLVGLETAKSLGFAWKIPVIGVNHIEGHVLSNLLESRRHSPLRRAGTSAAGESTGSLKFNKKRLPLIVLTVSGGHTELLFMKDIGNYQLLGRTRDDAAGEAFDKVAKLLDLPYPGGPSISSAAEKGSETAFPFPRPMLSAKNYDFSFAGLKTAVAREVAPMSARQRKQRTPDIAASFQRAVVDTLLGKVERAVTQYRAREFWIVGGVAANTLLRKEAQRLATRVKVAVRIPSFALCTDNAAMIASVVALNPALARKANPRALLAIQADPNLDLVV